MSIWLASNPWLTVVYGIIVLAIVACVVVFTPWSIALFTFREGLRKKTLIGFLILSILVIFGSMFMTAMMYDTGGTVATDVDVKLIKDICITAVSIFGVLIAIFISASVVPTEIENKVIYTVLSKPVRRFQYLLGKFVGVQITVLVNLLLMGVLFSIALYIKEPIFPRMLLYSIFLTYFEFLIVSAFTFAVAAASTSAVLPTIAGLFIYITGNLTQYLESVVNRSEVSENAADKALGWIAWVLRYTLPDLQNFSLKTQILGLQINDTPKDIQIPNLVVYGMLYALAGYIIAYWVFRRKEL
ncbi:MAG TPA: ABC transporter permease subunit [Candidatus Hydrogenedentes bacterium]|nr:ABC transporter permease subunit [Candidatus Hydrogenedentota bacterium]HQH51278.1 ABC transporter permease subunit [Candidatus Hydrogenedentota bacterium]